MIPKTYDAWKTCIVEKCKIKLTKEFVQQRLSIYQDKNNPETKKFISLYGETHLENILHWLKKTL